MSGTAHILVDLYCAQIAVTECRLLHLRDAEFVGLQYVDLMQAAVFSVRVHTVK